jgi:hypothetical protein
LIGKIEYKPIRDYISRCERVQNDLNVDLYNEYVNDGGVKLLKLLKYSKNNQKRGIIPKCGIIFQEGVNYYNGLSTLRSTLKKYFKFCETL